MNIGIIGTGYVGLVTGVCLATKGHKVFCADVIPEKIESINNGKSPIFEEGLDDLLQTALESQLLEATTDIDYVIEKSDVIFICVGTPSLPDGSMNYEYVEEAARNIGRILKEQQKFKVIIVKSTCIPGTTTNHVGPIIEQESGLKVQFGFGLGMNPEFLREGVAVNDFLYPDRVVIGVSDENTKNIMMQCYDGFIAPFVIVDPTSAEMIKYAANTFLATKISFFNEMANLAEKFEADISVVTKAVGMDHRISEKFMNAGIGWGGSCFPKDIRALLHKSREFGISSKLLQAALDTNEAQPFEAIRLLKEELGDEKLKNKRIAVLGLAFKPNTDDMREAPSIPIINLLLKEGASVVATDPIAIEEAKKLLKHKNLEFVTSADEALNEADACVLVTEWREYTHLPFENFIDKMKSPIIIDGRRQYNYEKMREKGIRYRGIGLGY
ncbi:MAG: UDP-glucose/GDP-mannose dehydrogenase family protein [Candidatus Heimdallarchaeota archaeon]|nr:UDP-glucose/GDP-mannose dehydrogenase family protein [Candidatus Heimdallarchaeota archaeon]MCK4770137.1 UDP-glucose/GDP-mannose dehydrogenase family protein [Candidatus Heimdallarchaeota archaeon]